MMEDIPSPCLWSQRLDGHALGSLSKPSSPICSVHLIISGVSCPWGTPVGLTKRVAFKALHQARAVKMDARPKQPLKAWNSWKWVKWTAVRTSQVLHLHLVLQCSPSSPFVCHCFTQSSLRLLPNSPSAWVLWPLSLHSGIYGRATHTSHAYTVPYACGVPHACTRWVKINVPLRLRRKLLKSLMNLSPCKRLLQGLSQSLRTSGLHHKWDECLLKMSGIRQLSVLNWSFL